VRNSGQIYDQIVVTAKQSLAHRGASGPNLDALVRAVALGVAEAMFDAIASLDIMTAAPPIVSLDNEDRAVINEKFERLTSALKMLGDQVMEHNQALQQIVSAPVQDERPRFVQCYCGWRHTGGQCTVCGRYQASGHS